MYLAPSVRLCVRLLVSALMPKSFDGLYCLIFIFGMRVELGLG